MPDLSRLRSLVYRRGLNLSEAVLPTYVEPDGTLHAFASECGRAVSGMISSLGFTRVVPVEEVLKSGHSCFEAGIQYRSDRSLVTFDEAEELLLFLESQLHHVSDNPGGVVDDFMRLWQPYRPFTDPVRDVSAEAARKTLARHLGVGGSYERLLRTCVPSRQFKDLSAEDWDQLDEGFYHQSGREWPGPQPGGVFFTWGKTSLFSISLFDPERFTDFFLLAPQVALVPKSALELLTGVEHSTMFEVDARPTSKVLETALVLYAGSPDASSSFFLFEDALKAAELIEGGAS